MPKVLFTLLTAAHGNISSEVFWYYLSMDLVCSAKSLIPEVLFMFPTAAKAPDHLNRMIKAIEDTNNPVKGKVRWPHKKI